MVSTNARAKLRDGPKTKERILSCAIREFSQRGYGGARIQNIVEESEVNISLLYQYFGNKESLFIAVMEHAYGVMRAHHRDMGIRDLEPLRAMEALVRGTFRTFLKYPEIIGLLNSENLHQGRHIAKSPKIRTLYSPLIDTIRDVLVRGQRAGVFLREVDPTELFVSISGISYFYLSNKHTLSVILDRDLMAPAALKRRENHITEVILGYLTSNTGITPAEVTRARRR